MMSDYKKMLKNKGSKGSLNLFGFLCKHNKSGSNFAAFVVGFANYSILSPPFSSPRCSPYWFATGKNKCPLQYPQLKYQGC